MKKIILSILAVIVVGISLMVFLTIHSFNAENYKDQVVQTLEALTGRKVVVGGEVNLTWNPLPTFTMNQLTVSNAEKSATKQMVTIDQVQVEIEWTSFFKNPLVIKRVILKKPDIFVERQYSYQTNFFFPILFNTNRGNDQNELLSSASMTGTTIDSLEIEGGTLTWHNHLNSEKIVIHNINGKGEIKTLDGPYTFDGEFQFLNQPFKMQLQTDKLLVASPLQMTLSLENPDSQTNFKMAAILDFSEKEDQWLNIAGSYSSKNPNLFFKKFGMGAWNSVGTLSGSYKVEVQPKLTQFKDIIFSQKDDDKTILSAKLNLTQGSDGKKLLSVIADVVDLKLFNSKALVYLSQHAIDFDFHVEKALLNKIVLAPLSVKGSTQKDALDIQASATLPQNGMEKGQNGAVSFKGKYDITQQHLSGDISCTLADTLAWAYDVFDKKYLPQSGAKNLSIMGSLDMTPQKQTTEIKVGSLDDVQFTGKITHTSENWQTDLVVKNFNLDNYYTLPDDFFAQLYAQVFGTSEKTFPSFSTLMGWNIEISNMTFNRLLFPLVRLKGKFETEKMTLSDITLKMSDENILSLSGTLDKAGTSDISFDKANVHFITNDVKKWFFLTQKLDLLVQKGLDAFNTSLTYSGNLQQGNLQFSFVSQGYEASTDGQVQNILNVPELYANKVHFSCPNISKFVKMLGWTTPLLEKMPIALDYNGVLTKTPESVLFQQGELKLGKDKAEISGKYTPKENHLTLDVQSDNLNLNLPWETIKTYWDNPEQSFLGAVLADFSMDGTLQAKQLELGELLYKNLQLQTMLTAQKLDIKEFSFEGKNKTASFNFVGELTLKDEISLDGHLKMTQIPMAEGIFTWDEHSLGQGNLSIETDIKGSGHNMQSLWNSFQFSTPFEWAGAILTGVNLASLKKTTLAALEMTEVPADFVIRLTRDFQDGNTPLPSLKGKLKLEQGQLSFLNVKGENDLVNVAGFELVSNDVGKQIKLEIPFVLKLPQNLSALILKLSDTQIMIEKDNFVGSLSDTVKILSTQNHEKKQQKLKQEKEQKNIKMQQSAEQILSQTETLIKILQEKMTLNPSAQANEKMAKLNKAVDEIRHLAVKPNMTDAEYTNLLGKTKMLAAQAKDFNNWFGVSDFVNRKKITLKNAEESANTLNQMEKIYQENPRSVLMAEIIVNARSVAKSIQTDAEQLKTAKEKNTILQLMNHMDENLLKLKKAHDYMQGQNQTKKE